LENSDDARGCPLTFILSPVGRGTGRGGRGFRGNIPLNILIGILFLAPLFLFSAVNIGPSQALSTSGIGTEKLLDGLSGSVKNISVNFNEPTIGKAGQFKVFNIDGCSITDKYGYQLPVKVITIDLPKGASVSSVRLTGGRWCEIYGEYNIAPSSLSSPLRGEGQGEGGFLPGTFIDAGYSRMASGTVVSISIYPVQYNPKTKKAIFLQSADIELSYGVETATVPQVLRPLSSSGDVSLMSLPPGSYDTVECLIITPKKYESYADTLKGIHQSQGLGGRLGTPITTEVITIEEIAALRYGETNQPPLASLPTSLCPEGDFTTRTDANLYPNRNSRIAPRFNTRLAQKIISFLLDCHDAPGYENPVWGEQKGYYSMHNLQYVVILGNANEVPPSDYVYSTVTMGPQYGTDDYGYWVPTDYFYSACSHQGLTNLNPYVGLGRIPVSRSEATEISTGLIISGVSPPNTISINMGSDPGDLSNYTVVITSGAAKGRWLDIESSSYNAGVLTLTLRANRNNNEAWMTDPAIAVGNMIDIIDTRPQMQALINKISAWVNARTGNNDWFRNISFAGGTYKAVVTKSETATARPIDASKSTIFWDELDCVEAINKIDLKDETGDDSSLVAGLVVRKYFATDIDKNGSPIDSDAFITSHIGGVLQNDSSRYTGILYFAGDGGTNFIYLEDGIINSTNVLGYSGSSTNQPIILSHAGSTGAFDEDLWDGPGASVSFGKATLLSGKGSIAYFGPARYTPELINWSRKDSGLFEHSTQWTNELTIDILRRYHRAKSDNVKINDIISKALGDYYAKNGGSNIYHFRTLVGFSLLGDPCIYIPPPAVHYPDDFAEYANFPTAEPLNPTRRNSDKIPVYEVGDSSTITVNISHTCESGSQNEITLVDCRYYNAEDRKTGTTGTYITPSFDDVDTGKTDTTNGPGLYFVRVSQREKNKDYYTKEKRYYFEVVNTFTPSGDILVIDDDQPRRYTSNNNHPDWAEQAWQEWYPDYEDYYTAALTALGKSYKVWHVENKSGAGNVGGQGRHGEVTQEVLDAYKGAGKAVVWFTGNDWFTTILDNERTYLTNFLNAGGHLFLTGQDIGWDIGDTSFYQNTLRASLVQDDIRLFQIDGIGIDDLSSGLSNIIITGTGGANNQRWPSEIDPQSGASSCLLYNPSGSGGGARQSTGTAGIKYYNSTTHQAHVYFSFGFEAINKDDASSNGRKQVMAAVLNWLGSPTSTGLFTATGGDGVVTLKWTNPQSGTYPGVLILRKVGGYPTGTPVNGTPYTVGQTIGDGTVIYSTSPGVSPYSDTNVTNGTTYYYIAYVFNSTHTYQLLGQDYATPQTGGGGALPAPENLRATAIEDPEGSGNWRIELSWIDKSTDEDGFQIARKVGETGTWDDGYATVGANVTSYTDGPPLTPDTVYYYRVRAYKGTDVSNWSNVASAATSHIVAPTNFIAVGGTREVWLSWNNNSLGADGIKIYRRHPRLGVSNPDWELVDDINSESVSYKDHLTSSPNIPDGRPYYYQLRPYKGTESKEEWWSDIVWTNPIPSAFPAGEDPTNLQALPGWNTVVVRFDDRTTNESSYWVELWNKTPNNTEYPYKYYYLPAFEGTGMRETVLTITTPGNYYLRLIAYHKSGYGFSRYATVSGGSGTYVSFEIVGESSRDGGEAGTCFIATAAFGTPMAKEVVRLREFRDRYLLTNRPGRAFVRWYYRHSPRLAGYIRQRSWARLMVRGVLRPLVWFLSVIMR